MTVKAIEFKVVSQEPFRNVVARLRAQDEVEVCLMHSEPLLEVLERSVAVSEEACVAYIDGNPEALLGLAEVSPEVGVPWMVGTDELAKNARHWMPIARRWVDRWQGRYPVLTNYVHKKNSKAIRWLRWMGFEFLDTEVPGHPDFLQFVRHRDV